MSDPSKLPPHPGDAVGFPSRAADLDAFPGFSSPPAGYGEVPFYWWVGDPLTKERLSWQLDQLKANGVTGLQVNYAHGKGGGISWGLPYASDPPIFSDAWWELWNWAVQECKKRGMAIGLSDYTLAWPGNQQWIDEIMADPQMQGSVLESQKLDAPAGKRFTLAVGENVVSLVAFPVRDGQLDGSAAVDLLAKVKDKSLTWEVPQGVWQVVMVSRRGVPQSIDPMNATVGAKVIEKHFQRFENHCPGEGGKGLNYFFQDELNFGVHGNLWSARLGLEFRKRKGYDLAPVLGALFVDIGPATPKIRMDYSDVMVALEEESYFRPIFEWHWKRGMLYGCDQGSRGQDLQEFGDYFRGVRWFTAPGHDTPGVGADLIKGKVSSSISHLYQRPRVWLEGYHSSGWGASPAALMTATRDNFIYGCNLLSLHGLYYTTHGGFWEWAPPCYHFRMPYWPHMGTYLKYFERLSYVLSQGVHRCDVAILYPVATAEAGLDGKGATKAAFSLGAAFFDQGIDFDFMDFESLARAKILDKQLQVSGEAYRVLVLPAMAAVRESTIRQALEFYRNGGMVIAVGALPQASDRIGRDDAQLDAMVKEIFGVTAAGAKDGNVRAQTNAAGGIGLLALDGQEITTLINKSLVRDFFPGDPRDPAKPGRAHVLHRKVGPRDIYMVQGAARNAECFFRAKGKVELWDPWTGQTRPIHTFRVAEHGTYVRLPLEEPQANLIVFSPGEAGTAIEATNLEIVTAAEVRDGLPSVAGFTTTGGDRSATVRHNGKTVELTGHADAPPPAISLEGPWEFELKPTMNNRWGDFRMPAFDAMIGAEARQFLYAEETEAASNWQTQDLDDSKWSRVTCSFGQQFWQMGPVDANVDTKALEQTLAAMQTIDPALPVAVGDQKLFWKPYAYSTRWGIEDDPGEQGYHGLKELISDEFLAATGRTYLWTTAVAPKAMRARLLQGGLSDLRVWLNGAPVAKLDGDVPLAQGANRLLLRCDGGRGHFVLEAPDSQAATQKFPLSMSWYNRPGVLGLDCLVGKKEHVGWYRFTAPPGLRAMTFVAFGQVQGWANAQELRIEPGKVQADGSREYKATILKPNPGMTKVALRITQAVGHYGGAALPEPIALDCGVGQASLGDWSKMGALVHYSGGAWYRKTIDLAAGQIRGQMTLHLGSVVATAEVHVNGKLAGVCIAPPWTVDITPFIRSGANRIEILVYNTLANHYGTIPSQYRGTPTSGLMGPVTIETAMPVTLRAIGHAEMKR